MIDPAFLDELGRFRSAMKRQSSSVSQGDQRSKSVGEGLTFSDYRRYVRGDDTRLIDWKLYARTGEYFIKQFETERSLTVHVLVDASGSMGYGDGEANKFEYAAKLGLGFAYLTAEENNDFRVSVFTDRVERLDAGRSNRGELLALVDRLNDREPSGEGDFAGALDGYGADVRSRSLVVVLSDCLADPDAIETGLVGVGRSGIVVGTVLSPRELRPDPTGDTLFRDPETTETLRTYFGGARAASYRERLDAHLSAVEERCRRLRAEHALVNSGDDFFDSFGELWVG
ncbi:DUF58 domain-containing protein [Candidatus Halobonum tyrrellensis]|uniref:DUF58 domain-containing protein n=1 Tax=Candidatus Halobonum tyrrellensis G22 TaxID=1324957 RepID=V4GVE7_9EURY|nr:DUF58 domain-containing protein [Candidatus Halobonum tyrrellensis]ESP89136.1 hypothetical protein K933_05518 [Candidatus Halobonum tyrrellensis G22]